MKASKSMKRISNLLQLVFLSAFMCNFKALLFCAVIYMQSNDADWAFFSVH